MNKNFLRIGIGALLGIAFLTILMLLLKNPAAILWVGYGWSVWALIVFAFGLGFWASGSKIKYVLHAAYPLVIKSYSFITLLIAVIIGALSYFKLWTMPVGWFCLLEFAVLAVAAWKLMAMGAAKDAILATEEAVKVNTVSWKMLTADITAIAERTAADDQKTVNRIMEVIRFADPMEHPAVADIVEKISGNIRELGIAVDKGESEKIAEICTAIDRLVKERSNKLMIVK